MSLTPVGLGRRLNSSRELARLDRNQEMDPTALTTELFSQGTSVRADFFGNRGRGMCMYRLPDPREMPPGTGRVPWAAEVRRPQPAAAAAAAAAGGQRHGCLRAAQPATAGLATRGVANSPRGLCIGGFLWA